MVSMMLFPAIDLKDGACVRLRQGEMDSATVFSDHPAEQARQFAASGFEYLHVVDLNGAFAGHSVNVRAVESILAATGAKVQLGGGIRSMAAIENWLEAGIWRVILGTAALQEPQLVREACTLFPGRIAVGIDVRDGRVAVQGWSETASMLALELALDMQQAGASALIVTDIGRDGMKSGVNLELVRMMTQALDVAVIASGGVRGVADIRALRGIATGAILGRALYDGDIDTAEILAVAE